MARLTPGPKLMFLSVHTPDQAPSMPTCVICHRREADEVGSHIISRFLLESMYNDGAKGANKEQSFQIGAEGSMAYFGREVLPETIEHTLGRPGTDADTDGIPNVYVRDHVFCVACEKKLSFFESLYKVKVDVPLSRGKELTEQQLRIAHFFWLTIIYRWVATRFGHLQLERPTIVELAMITDAIIGNAASAEEIEQNCLNVSITNNLFIGYLPFSADNGRHQVFSHPEKQEPYLLFVNQYILAFDYHLPEHVAQLESELEISLGITASGTSLKVFSVEERETAIKYFWELAAPYLAQQFKDVFIERYTKHHKRPPQPAIVEAFFGEYTQADLPETVKYAAQRQAQLIQKYILSS